MSAPTALPCRREAVKAVLVAGIVVNIGAFAWLGEHTEALESVAWLVLLVLFDLETRRPRWLRGAARTAVRTGRLAAAAAVLAAAFAYPQAQNWLDTVNAWLWIGVVVVLETELRRPTLAARHRAGFRAAAGSLYLGLVLMVGAWLSRGAWFDAWDAALWLAAFVLIEQSASTSGSRTA